METKSLTGLHRLALNSVTVRNGEVVTTDGLPFDATSYSYFKYGSGEVADYYAHQLSTMLLKEHLTEALANNEPVILCGSAYKRVPTAAYHVAASVAAGLRFAGINTFHGHIARGKLAEGDYSAMSLSERELKMSDNQLSLDVKLFQGKHVIMIDDICISGAHERSVVSLMRTVPIRSLTMAYVVEMDRAVAQADPAIESRINHAAIKSVRDLLAHIRTCESFSVTARIVKFILEADTSEAEWFIDRIAQDKPQVIRTLFVGSVDDGYDQMPRYRANFALIAQAESLRQQKVRDRITAVPTTIAASRFKPSTLLARIGL